MSDKTLLQRVLDIAKEEIGVKEYPGSQSNPRILEYQRAMRPKVLQDEVPWCAAFVNWVLAQAGIAGTGSPMARSFLKWGEPLKSPVSGCVVILKRGIAPLGHVGFFVRRSRIGFVDILGGNQSDQVKISTFRERDVLGYRLPSVREGK